MAGDEDVGEGHEAHEYVVGYNIAGEILEKEVPLVFIDVHGEVA